MHNKDIKNLLKAKASEVEIKDFTNEIINNINHTPIINKAHKRKFRPFAYAISGVVLVCSFVFIALLLVKVPDNVIKPGENPTPTPGPITELSKHEMVLTREAVALGNVLETISSISTSEGYLPKLVSLDDEEDNEDLDDEDESEDDNKKLDISIYKKIALEMNAFLYSADAFINSENLESSVSLNEDTSIPYTYMMNIIMLDHNFKKEYIMYYNESKHDNISNIDGIIIINDKSYPISGERKDKKDETNLILRLYLSDSSYIAIENETEVNENEYEYSFYKGGKLIRSVIMEVESENGLKEASIEITDGNIKKEVELEYHEDRVEATYCSSEIELEMTIEIFDSYYLYYFEDADLKITLNK